MKYGENENRAGRNIMAKAMKAEMAWQTVSAEGVMKKKWQSINEEAENINQLWHRK
jgi:hypothetical protein